MFKLYFVGLVVFYTTLPLLIFGATLAVSDGKTDRIDPGSDTDVLPLDDMRFSIPNSGSRARNGIINRSARWPGGVVIYQLDPRFSAAELSVIQRGITDITSKTCITFKLRTNEPSYVSVRRGDPGSGCWSYVGRTGKVQILNLQGPTPNNGATCIVPRTVSHEFIHALGYYHEHSRPDRDDFITIKWDNVQPRYKFAFDKYGTNYVSTFSVPYDYRSIMQYRANSFAINPKLPTMEAKQPNVVLGGDTVSPLDVKKLNNMYAGICPSTRSPK